MTKLILATALTIAAVVPVSAQPTTDTTKLNCADFRRHEDGSWSPTHEVTIRYPNGLVSLAAGVSFPAGGTYMGMPFARMLDEECQHRRWLAFVTQGCCTRYDLLIHGS